MSPIRGLLLILILPCLALADGIEATRTDPESTADYVARATARFDAGDHDKAIDDCTEAIRLDPKSAPAYFVRGLANESKGRLDEAMADANAALKIDSKSAQGFLLRGRVWLAKGDFDKAIQNGTKAIEFDPNLADAFYLRGSAWQAKGEFGKALADYVETARLDPNSFAAHNDAAWILATCADDRIRDGGAAIEHAKKACELTEWKFGGAIDTLAAAYAEAGDFLSALRWQDRAIAMALSDAEKEGRTRRLALYQDQKVYRETRTR